MTFYRYEAYSECRSNLGERIARQDFYVGKLKDERRMGIRSDGNRWARRMRRGRKMSEREREQGTGRIEV